jgi:chromate reductase
MKPKLVAFAGSTRHGSINRKALAVAVEGARGAGADVTVLDLRDFRLPLYEAEIDAGDFPQNATKLRDIFIAHHGFLIASPEYNSSVTPLLKNTIDWVSRHDGKLSLVPYQGKTAGLVAASGGALGGLRGLVHLRSILGNIGVHVIPDQFAVSKANEAFDDSGKLKDPGQEKLLRGVGAKLAEVTEKIAS